MSDTWGDLMDSRREVERLERALVSVKLILAQARAALLPHGTQDAATAIRRIEEFLARQDAVDSAAGDFDPEAREVDARTIVVNHGRAKARIVLKADGEIVLQYHGVSSVSMTSAEARRLAYTVGRLGLKYDGIPPLALDDQCPDCQAERFHERHTSPAQRLKDVADLAANLRRLKGGA